MTLEHWLWAYPKVQNIFDGRTCQEKALEMDIQLSGERFFLQIGLKLAWVRSSVGI